MREKKIRIARAHDALLVIDVQPTFTPGGGLAVQGGDEILPLIFGLLPRFNRERRIATKDRHPRGHISLASSYVGVEPMTTLTCEGKQFPTVHLAPCAKFSEAEFRKYLDRVRTQVLWPDHAIAGTAAAELHPEMPESNFGYVLVKGLDPACDSYSAFRDNLRRPTELADVLCERGVERVFLCGLAFDYCVGWSAVDATKAGFETFVVRDATRPVGIPDNSIQQTEADFERTGVQLISASQLVS